jgi:chromosome partitioning protein
MGRVFALANQKGGVGKTTTAINLGASLAVAERRTLVVDLDPQANAASGLGLGSAATEGNIYDVMIGRRSITEVIRPVNQLEFLDAVPSGRDLSAVDVELVGVDGRESVLLRALEPIRERYDYILIDCPPSLGLLTINALVAADSVLVPLQCEYYALEGLSALLHTIDSVRAASNEDLSVDGIILTMHDSRNNLSVQVEAEVRRHFPDLVFSTIIPRNVRLSESPSFGKPVVLYDIRSKGCQAYLKLAQEILKEASP